MYSDGHKIKRKSDLSRIGVFLNIWDDVATVSSKQTQSSHMIIHMSTCPVIYTVHQTAGDDRRLEGLDPTEERLPSTTKRTAIAAVVPSVTHLQLNRATSSIVAAKDATVRQRQSTGHPMVALFHPMPTMAQRWLAILGTCSLTVAWQRYVNRLS